MRAGLSTIVGGGESLASHPGPEKDAGDPCSCGEPRLYISFAQQKLGRGRGEGWEGEEGGDSVPVCMRVLVRAHKLICACRMSSRWRRKPAKIPSVDDLLNDSAHVPRPYGDDELPLSDGPGSVEDAVEEDQVPVVEDAEPEPGPPVERPDWSTAGVLNDPIVREVMNDPPSYANMIW